VPLRRCNEPQTCARDSQWVAIKVQRRDFKEIRAE
jgi:hypothetical protein